MGTISIRIIALSLLLASSQLRAQPEETPQLIGIIPNVAIANLAFANQLRTTTWQSLEGVWEPDEDTVIRGLEFLKSEQGRRQMLEHSNKPSRMTSSLNQLDTTQFQVIGIIKNGRRCLLYDGTPLNSGHARLWLSKLVSSYVYDGGPAFWSVVLDVSPFSVVQVGCRP